MAGYEAADRFRDVFDFAPFGFVTLEDGDTIAEINMRGVELLDCPHGALVGGRFTSHVAPPSLPQFSAMLAEARTTGAVPAFEIELLLGDAAVPVVFRARRLPRERRTVLLAFEDISDRRARELESARADRALREAARKKDEFLSVLSHELRNPLAPIRMSVAVLEMIGMTDDRAREAVDIIARSSEHLTRLIDDLLDVTRITRGKINLKCEAVELSALVERVVEEHRPQFAASGIRLDLRLSPAPLRVNGDPTRLAQIVGNLLGNAEKFSSSGSRVSVVTEVVNRIVFLRVHDTGIGIAPEVIGELGVPFVQAPQAIDRSRGGLGLGLALVRSLAELHGGALAIRSAGVGRGTEVVVSLPEHVQRADVAPRTKFAPPRRVLVIEDNPDAARSLAKALALRGHTVEVAHEGIHGIARARDLVPDLVLCDLGLPDCDGYTVARRLREDPRMRDVSLVALSGYARSDDVRASSAAGFDRHLAKPANLTHIDEILRELPVR